MGTLDDSGVGWGGREKRCPDVLALPPRCCVDGCSAISVLGVCKLGLRGQGIVVA